MAILETREKAILEKLFQMETGGVLDFNDKKMVEFFSNDMEIDIKASKYFDHTNIFGNSSPANRMRNFWREDSDEIVGKSILKLLKYIDSQTLVGNLGRRDFPEAWKIEAENAANRLLGKKATMEESAPRETFINGNINIELRKDVFNHVLKLLNNKHYFNAVEESYKIVRKKLQDITGQEQAHLAFAESHYEKIFGRRPVNKTEENFFEGVKLLHLSIQRLRNEKAHTPANDIDKNLALHYISLASLAYDLITRKN